MDTNIQKFYKNQTLFMTGGTGFVGKAVIEKLLRSTDVQRIYILVREKKGTLPADRLKNLGSDVIFERLRQIKPHALEKLSPILGDCMLPNLGISESDRKTLIEEVNIVFHVAATVRFDEPLNVACQINIQATLDVLKLAADIKDLKALVHTSSAFSNCIQKEINEIYYMNDIGMTLEEMLRELKELGAEEFNEKFKQPSNRYPNTYTFTKSLAEEAVMRYGKAFPCCIFRPAIITSTKNEPIAGWLDSFFGPFTVTHGVIHGIVRVIIGKADANAALVPVDFCSNQIMACGWYVGTLRRLEQSAELDRLPPIFNLVPDEMNPVFWDDLRKALLGQVYRIPPCYLLWMPILLYIESTFMFTILNFLLHIIPAYIIDFILFVRGKQPKMRKMYGKLGKNVELLGYFVANNFVFSNKNTTQLWQSLSEEDRRLFCFNMVHLDWSAYLRTSIGGMRQYLCKAKSETIIKDLKVIKRFRMLHYFLMFVLLASGLVFLTYLLVLLTSLFE